MADPPKRPAGRPRVDARDHSVVVGVTLAARTYDKLCKAALYEDVSVPEMIRRQLKRRGSVEPER